MESTADYDFVNRSRRSSSARPPRPSNVRSRRPSNVSRIYVRRPSQFERDREAVNQRFLHYWSLVCSWFSKQWSRHGWSKVVFAVFVSFGALLAALTSSEMACTHSVVGPMLADFSQHVGLPTLCRLADNTKTQLIARIGSPGMEDFGTLHVLGKVQHLQQSRMTLHTLQEVGWPLWENAASLSADALVAKFVHPEPIVAHTLEILSLVTAIREQTVDLGGDIFRIFDGAHERYVKLFLDVGDLVRSRRQLWGLAWLWHRGLNLITSGTSGSFSEIAAERFGVCILGLSKHISTYAGAVSALTEVLVTTLQELDTLDILLNIEVGARRELCTNYDRLDDKQRSAASRATYPNVCFADPEAFISEARDIKEGVMWFGQTWSPIHDAYVDLAQTATAVDERLRAYLDPKRRGPRQDITVDELHAYSRTLLKRLSTLRTLHTHNLKTISARLSGVADVGKIDMHKQ